MHAVAPAVHAATDCAGLAGVKPEASTIVSSSIVSGPSSIGGSRVTSTFCRVEGVARPSADSEIRFEVWLPATADKWTGRLKVNGTGGYAGGVPYTVVRATQFFEFLGWIAGSGGGDTVRVPAAPMQPLAADDVADALADICAGPPANGMVELAGPETASIAEFVGRYLAASGDKRAVVADPQARYYGAALDARGLTPDGANPRIGPARFEEWLRRSVR